MMPQMQAVLLCVLATLMLAQDARCREAGGKPAVYKNWPPCKRGSEFVNVIKQEYRRPGDTYHERVSQGGITKTYLCLPCTQCASGVRELRPCSVHSDTVCSPTECAVPECILDETFYACRLPGDPNDFSSMAAMMDPCDPKKASVTPSSTKGLLTVDSSTIGFPEIVRRVESTRNSPSRVKTYPQKLQPGKSFSTDRNQDLSPLQEALLLVIAVFALFTFAVVLVGAVVYFRKSRKDRPGMGHNTRNSIGTSV